VKSFSSLSRLCVLVSLTLLSGAHAGIVVNLGKVVINLGPDGRAKREIEVANPDNRTADVTVFASDWKQDENGAVEAIDPSTNKAPDSATGWIAVNPQRFVLKKGEKKIVTVSLATPKEPMGLKEYRSMVFAETNDERPAETTAPGREMRIRTISRIGTKIFVNNPAAAVKLDCAVTKVAEATRDGKRGLEIQTANNSNVHIQSDNSNVVFRDEAGKPVASLPLPSFSVLPGQKRTVFFDLPEQGKSKLEKGKKYNALAVLDYGGSDLVAGELEFTY
jgi:P pilus assembly chaperone PapD